MRSYTPLLAPYCFAPQVCSLLKHSDMEKGTALRQAGLCLHIDMHILKAWQEEGSKLHN